MACALTIEVATDPMIEHLAHTAFAAMDRAGLDDSFDHLAGVLSAGGRFLDGACVGQRLYVRLKPFAELALHDAISISTDRLLDAATKERRLMEMFTLAGLE